MGDIYYPPITLRIEGIMKKRLLFMADAKIGGEVTYKKGNIYEIDDSTGSASRWIKRLMAEEVANSPVEEAEKLVEFEENEDPKKIVQGKYKQKVESRKNKKQDETVGPEDLEL
jgi:hypothetical protein